MLLRYLVIELCIGNLQDLVCGKKCYKGELAMTDASYLPILCQISRGLDYLHQLRILHGNLKPSNILISLPNENGDHNIKLADFGLFFCNGENSKCPFVFSEGWMCSFDSRDPVKPSFDIFSLGCIFGFIVSNGINPFGINSVSRINNRQSMTLTLGKMAICVQDVELFQLISKMVLFEDSQRPTAYQVSQFVFMRQKRALENGVQKQQSRSMPALLPLNPQALVSDVR